MKGEEKKIPNLIFAMLLSLCLVGKEEKVVGSVLYSISGSSSSKGSVAEKKRVG